MARSINNTHSVQLSLTVTPEQHEALKHRAESDAISVRELLRQIVADHTGQERLRVRFTPAINRDLEHVATLTGTSTGDLVARYTLAGVTHDLMKLGTLPKKD